MDKHIIYTTQKGEAESMNVTVEDCIEKLTKTEFIISKLDLCEGGSFSTVIFNSDIQLSFLSFLDLEVEPKTVK